MNKNEYAGFSQVFKFTFTQAWKSSALKITTLIMVLIMLVAFPVMALFNKDDEENIEHNIKKAYLLDEIGAVTGKTLEKGLEGKDSISKLEFVDSDSTKDKLIEQISKKHDDEIVIVSTLDMEAGQYSFKIYYDPDSNVSDDEIYVLADDITEWFDKYKLDAFDISDEAKEMVNKEIVFAVNDASYYLNGKAKDVISDNDFNVVYAFLMISYMVVLMSASMVANKVVEEKANRVVEYLMTTVRPMALILGKVTAMLLCTVIELSAIAVSALISTNIAEKMFDYNVTSGLSKFISTDAIKNISVLNAIICIVIIAVGIYIYGLLAGLFGASVSKMEDLQQGLKAYNMIVVIFFLMGVVAVEMMLFSGINVFVKFVEIFPLSSVFVLPGAIFIGKASMLSVVIALVLQLITAFIVQKIVSLIYESIIVMNGNPVTIKQMFEIARQTSKSKKRRA